MDEERCTSAGGPKREKSLQIAQRKHARHGGKVTGSRAASYRVQPICMAGIRCVWSGLNAILFCLRSCRT